MALAYPDKSKLLRSISFRRIFDNAPDAMALAGLDGHLLKVNRAPCRILGYDEKYLLSSDFEAMIFADGSGEDTRYRFSSPWLSLSDRSHLFSRFRLAPDIVIEAVIQAICVADSRA